MVEILFINQHLILYMFDVEENFLLLYVTDVYSFLSYNYLHVFIHDQLHMYIFKTLQ